ncbi:MAG: hypothetical protein ACP5TF_03090 [Candidatus Acidifodinimicrobium sp.]
MVKEVGDEALKIWAYQNFNKIKDELFEKFVPERGPEEPEESCNIELNYNNLLTDMKASYRLKPIVSRKQHKAEKQLL